MATKLGSSSFDYLKIRPSGTGRWDDPESKEYLLPDTRSSSARRYDLEKPTKSYGRIAVSRSGLVTSAETPTATAPTSTTKLKLNQGNTDSIDQPYYRKRIAEAKSRIDNSEDDAAGKFCHDCLLLFYLILYVIFAVNSVSAIVIGSIFLKASNCLAIPSIAPLLLASGVIGTYICLIEIFLRFRTSGSKTVEIGFECRRLNRLLQTLLIIVELILFIYVAILLNSYPSIKYLQSSSGEESAVMEDDGNASCNMILILFTGYATGFYLTFMPLAFFVYYGLLCCFLCSWYC